MEYFIAIKRNKLLIKDRNDSYMHCAKGKELTGKATYIMIPFI